MTDHTANEFNRAKSKMLGDFNKAISDAAERREAAAEIAGEGVAGARADAGNPRNVEAVTTEIERVKQLTVVASQGPSARNAYAWHRKASWQDARRSPARNKGRRTMGRAGGR